MQHFGPFKVSVRLSDESAMTNEEVGQLVAEFLAERFGVKVYNPGEMEAQGHRPFPGVTVEILPLIN